MIKYLSKNKIESAWIKSFKCLVLIGIGWLANDIASGLAIFEVAAAEALSVSRTDDKFVKIVLQPKGWLRDFPPRISEPFLTIDGRIKRCTASICVDMPVYSTTFDLTTKSSQHVTNQSANVTVLADCQNISRLAPTLFSSNSSQSDEAGPIALRLVFEKYPRIGLQYNLEINLTSQIVAACKS
jgi:hypothetical protein